MDYKQKYLKYKTKYLDLKGGRHRFKVGDEVEFAPGFTYKGKAKITAVNGVGEMSGLTYNLKGLDNTIYRDIAEYNLLGKCPFKVGDNLYVRVPLRVFNIKGQLRGLSEEEIQTMPANTGIEIEPKKYISVNNYVTVLEVLFKDSLIPLVEGTLQKNCYRVKVRHGAMELIINSTNVGSKNNLVLVPDEVNCEIFKYKGWKELVELSKNDPIIAGEIRKCNFDFFNVEDIPINIFRKYFPNAVGLDLDPTYKGTNFDGLPLDPILKDTDFDLFKITGAPGREKRIKRLQISSCNQITDKLFIHFKGIPTIVMYLCNQVGITNEAFRHLEGIHTLNIGGCYQEGITDEAFSYLKGVQILNMSSCNQVGITDKAFSYLEGIKTLNMSYCNQVGITDVAFSYLKGIKILYMQDCDQVGITEEAFKYLIGIEKLYMSGCRPDIISSARRLGLNVIA